MEIVTVVFRSKSTEIFSHRLKEIDMLNNNFLFNISNGVPKLPLFFHKTLNLV